MLNGVLRTRWKIFYKTTEKCLAKILKAIQQKYWYLVCKHIEKCSQKILTRVLPKCWEGVCKTIEKCSAKLLRRVPNSDKKTNNFFPKTQGLGLFPATSWLRDFEMLKDKKHLLREKPFEKLWYRLVHKKGDTADEWSYDS